MWPSERPQQHPNYRCHRPRGELGEGGRHSQSRKSCKISQAIAAIVVTEALSRDRKRRPSLVPAAIFFKCHEGGAMQTRNHQRNPN
jgi:hypothetical protein